ncbi:MAG: transposase [Methanomicrobiaceae archaeon]|nr:transposase [Methanomicrobiaceae archaeon]
MGRFRRDPRRLFNSILYVLATGCTWHDVPAQYRYQIDGSSTSPRAQ